MFIEVVRRYLEALPPEQAGWLAGLRDPFVGKALSLLHGAPAFSWTIEELAKQVGLSRSVLAERFTNLVGTPPLHYLAKWRMEIAWNFERWQCKCRQRRRRNRLRIRGSIQPRIQEDDGDPAFNLAAPRWGWLVALTIERNWLAANRWIRRGCPLWVKSGHVQCKRACPLYPQSGHVRCNSDVRFGPKRTLARLFDHLVGGVHQTLRHCEAYRLRGFQIDYKIECSRLNDWQVGGLRALENSAGVDASLPVQVGDARPVTIRPPAIAYSRN